jgi:CheY-like chemotaxis protein
MKNGDTLETATVGLEGASWISASIGVPSMPCETLVAIGGNAHALDIDDLDREMQENEPFRDVLTRYSHALLIHSMRLTGCTGLHSLEQRCARWMLTTLDRIDQDRFSITHDVLAMLLGASRPSISLVIEQFEAQGILHVQRGQLRLGNRQALERASCDGYAVITHNRAGRTVGRSTAISHGAGCRLTRSASLRTRRWRCPRGWLGVGCGQPAGRRPRARPARRGFTMSMRRSTHSDATILVVDDDDGVRQLFARMLALEGYRVRTAMNAERGLWEVVESSPAAIILDLRMPLVDGLEFLRRLRTTQAHGRTPVAIVTGDYFLEDTESAELRALGATLLFKPLWLEDLVDLTRTLLHTSLSHPN